MKKILIISLMVSGFVFAGNVFAIGENTNQVSNPGNINQVSNPGTLNQVSNPGNINQVSNPGTIDQTSGNSAFNRPSTVPKLSLIGLITWLIGIVNQLVYLVIAASLVMFLYGIFKLSFVDGSKPDAREQSRRFMFWGIVSLFVMVSVWGLVAFLKVSFFGGSTDLLGPQFK